MPKLYEKSWKFKAGTFTGGWLVGLGLVWLLFYLKEGSSGWQALILLAGVFWFIFFPFFFINAATRPASIRCPNCGYTGIAHPSVKGSTIIEIGLWLIFLLPGALYSVWRVGSRKLRCPDCEFEYVVKLKSTA